MCEKIIVLAQLDHRRWISSCEHQIAHLNWDNVSVRLPLPQLRATGQALLECAQVAQRYRIAATGDVCVILDQYDLYQVWVSGVGLCLAPAEFERFCQLVGDACTHPATCERADAGLYPAVRPATEGPIRTTYHLFSVN